LPKQQDMIHARSVVRLLAGIVAAFGLTSGLILLACGAVFGEWLMALYGVCGLGVVPAFARVAMAGRSIRAGAPFRATAPEGPAILSRNASCAAPKVEIECCGTG